MASAGITALAIGMLLLIWAVSVRRSPFDAGLIALAALGAIYLGARSFVSLPQVFLIPECILAFVGVVMKPSIGRASVPSAASALLV